MFFKRKNKLMIELDERHFNKKDLRDEVVQKLREQGKECEIIDGDFLLIDGTTYILTEKNVPVKYGPPVQQAVLTEVDC